MAREGETNKVSVQFDVERRYLTSEGTGVIEATVDGERMRFEIARKGQSILVNRVPLTQLKLLFLGRENAKDLAERLKLEIYQLVNQAETETYLQQYRFLDATLFVSNDGFVKLVRGSTELYRGSIEDDKALKVKLVEVARQHGLSEGEAVDKIREIFETLRHLTRRLETIEVDGLTVRYADGLYARQTYVAGDEAYVALYLYGEWEVKEGVWVAGVRPVWFVSSNGVVREAEVLPFFSPMNIIPVELRVVRNAVLDVAEFKELKESIDAISRGEATPPTFRDVWNDVEWLLSTAMFIQQSELMKSVSYNMHSWFYDFFKICPQLAIVGESGSGKTELRDRITASTRTIPLTQGSSLPAMRRIINTMFPGISFDEKTLSEPDIQSFLRASHRRGSFIVIADRENVNRIYTYDPYGPRILTCLPSDYAELRVDTLGRHVVVNMVRGRVPDRLDLSREKLWSVLRKLYLLLLYRWKDYLEAWKAVDALVSEYLAGHGRDIVPIMLTSAILAGKDKFKLLYEVLMKEFKIKSATLEAKIEYLLNGVLRHIIDQNTLSGADLPKSIWIGPRDIVKANEGYYDRENEIHESWVRSLGRLLKNARSTGSLPFVTDSTRRKEGVSYEINLQDFFKYASSYGFKLPEDVGADVEKLEKLKKLGLTIDTVKEPDAEGAYVQIKNSAGISLFEEITSIAQTTPEGVSEEAERVISPKEARNELISEKPESSPISEKKPESSSSVVNAINVVSPEKDTWKEIIISKENIEALQEAVKPYGSDYWLASDVEAGYARAGGREFWRLIDFLSSEEWIRSNPQIWLEKYPGIEGRFRLRRR
jgi:hypothetical protein